RLLCAPPRPPPFPYTTLFRSERLGLGRARSLGIGRVLRFVGSLHRRLPGSALDRRSGSSAVGVGPSAASPARVCPWRRSVAIRPCAPPGRASGALLTDTLTKAKHDLRFRRPGGLPVPAALAAVTRRIAGFPALLPAPSGRPPEDVRVRGTGPPVLFR